MRPVIAGLAGLALVVQANAAEISINNPPNGGLVRVPEVALQHVVVTVALKPPNWTVFG